MDKQSSSSLFAARGRSFRSMMSSNTCAGASQIINAEREIGDCRVASAWREVERWHCSCTEVTFRKKPRVSSCRALTACCLQRRRTRSKPWSSIAAALTVALPWMARRVSPLTFSTITRPDGQYTTSYSCDLSLMEL